MAYNESGMLNNSAEESYLSALDNRLTILAKRPDATFLNILRGARGAYPTLVADRLKILGMDGFLPRDFQPASNLESNVNGPELHPLDFEWYFTPDCAAQIADLFTRQTGDILCLATPTVADSIARLKRNVLLLDNNPLIKFRLPANLSNLQFEVRNLYAPLKLDKCFPVVFFDAPWYTEPVRYWLWQASRAVSPGGTIAFSLFPPLLRPEAESERARILEQAEAIGEVQLREEALSYETPLFEQEALARCGIRLVTSWRLGDLVLVRVNKKVQTDPPFAAPIEDEWDSFLIGRQVVKLRKRTHYDNDFILAALEGLVDYIFPTVSMRDSRRTEIDLWTSRNRVAKVGQRSIVADALDCFAKGMTAADIAHSPKLSSIAITDREELLTSLCLILEIPLEE